MKSTRSGLDDLKRGFLRLFDLAPGKDIRALAFQLKQHEAMQELPASPIRSTASRLQLAFHIESLLEQLEAQTLKGESAESIHAELYDPINEYCSLPPDLPDIHFSPGAESGTRKLQNYRIKILTPPLAELEQTMHTHLKESSSHYLVFTHAVGRYLISRNFDGALLAHAQSRENPDTAELVVKKHLHFIDTLSQEDFSRNLTRHNHQLHPEQYRAKMLESLALLEAVMPLSMQHIRAGYEIADRCQAHASKLNYDCHPENAKYNDDGIVKEFDFSKTGMLVIPEYDYVQTRYWCTRDGTGLYDTLQRIDPIQSAGKNEIQELGAIYFLIRQLYRSLHNESQVQFDAYRSLLANATFAFVPEGNLFAQASTRTSLQRRRASSDR
jgi:hypothetical protein